MFFYPWHLSITFYGKFTLVILWKVGFYPFMIEQWQILIKTLRFNNKCPINTKFPEQIFHKINKESFRYQICLFCFPSKFMRSERSLDLSKSWSVKIPQWRPQKILSMTLDLPTRHWYILVGTLFLCQSAPACALRIVKQILIFEWRCFAAVFLTRISSYSLRELRQLLLESLTQTNTLIYQPFPYHQIIN